MEEIYSAKKVEQINDHLFIDACQIQQIGVNDMTVNVFEMKRRSLVNTRVISPEIV